MRLEALCNMTLNYRTEPAYGGGFMMFHLSDGKEASAYGEGDATFVGERLTGTARWVNYEHIRGDGMLEPNVHGIITMHDGALVLFSLEGRTLFVTPKGDQLLMVKFEAEDQRYRWLNTTFCVLEGVLDPDAANFKTKIYVCINELAEGN